MFLNQQKPPLDDALLMHYGVKGMKWGVRNERSLLGSKPVQTYETTVNAKAIGSPIKKMDKTIHTSTQDGAHQVAALLKSRYGYEITEIRAIEQTRANKNYIAYVESSSNKNASPQGTVFVQPRDLNPDLKKIENTGWFAKDTGNVRALMTHETAHSMFHADQKVVRTGFLKSEVQGGNHVARGKAMKAAEEAAKADGIKTKHMTKKVSGYAHASLWKEEMEAEMFSSYHWRTDPPRFVKVWGETLHKELGVDDTPFRKVVNDG